ncbi:acyl-CoA thioesterase [Lutimonas sp.]|uniref:acyl-CoA thioesterase n=1 Tax=Lutimonas sp. TaxID=1872403 RepID=UPI003D9ABC91
MDTPKNTVSYSYEIKVEEDHIDNLRHVNNVVYLQWVNDISEKHWNVLAINGLKEKYFWVVLRHELDYHNEAFLGDTLRLTTWVGISKGVKSVRYVEIFKEDKLLLKAASTWCLIDAKTLRPTRIKNDILEVLEFE